MPENILTFYFKKHRRRIYIAAAALIFINALEAVLPLIVKEAIDNLSGAADLNTLYLTALSYLGCSVVLAALRATWRVNLARAGADVGLDLRAKYLNHVLRLPRSFFDRKKGGELTSLANSDIETVRTLYDIGAVITLDAICGLIIPPLAMFYLEPRLALVLLAPLLGIPLATYLFDKKIHSFFKAVQEGLAALYAHMQESLDGIMVIKSFARENSALSRFSGTSRDYINKSLRLAKIESIFGPTLEVFVAASIILHISHSGGLVIEGALSLGTFVAFIRYLQMMAWPMEAIGLAVTIMQKSKVSSQRLAEIFNVKTESGGGLKPKHSDSRNAAPLSFKNVTFAYNSSERPAVKNLSLEIEEGERVTILGPVGSGKSTLLSLIPRLRDPQSGIIKAAGVDTKDWDLSALRREISFVPQEAFLFSRTVEENIALGSSGASTEEIASAASRAAIHDEILSMPGRFASPLGERGINLSGGQKQRLTIARALLKPHSLLIIDDALSAVDLESENRIIRSLAGNLGKRTSQIITGHRLSAVYGADRIIVLHEGEIIQQGSMPALLKEKRGWFYSFYEEQRIEEDLQHEIA